MTVSQALQGLDSGDNRAAEKKGEMEPGQTGTLTAPEAPRAPVPFHPTAQPSSDSLSTGSVLGGSWGCTDEHWVRPEGLRLRNRRSISRWSGDKAAIGPGALGPQTGGLNQPEDPEKVPGEVRPRLNPEERFRLSRVQTDGRAVSKGDGSSEDREGRRRSNMGASQSHSLYNPVPPLPRP